MVLEGEEEELEEKKRRVREKEEKKDRKCGEVCKVERQSMVNGSTCFIYFQHKPSRNGNRLTRIQEDQNK